jgi:hypothetical protein
VIENTYKLLETRLFDKSKEIPAIGTLPSHRDPFGEIPPYSSGKTPLKQGGTF